MNIRSVLFSMTLLMLIASSGAAFAQGNPCNPCGKANNPCNPCGKAQNPCNPCAKGAGSQMKMAINPCHKKFGQIFMFADSMKRNTVTFESEAPLENIVGTSNEVVGYLAFDPNQPLKGVRGEFKVPIKSIDTGIPLRNEHLVSEAWLNAPAHPYITFKVENTDYMVLTRRGDGFATYNVRLIGPFTVNGVSVQKRVDAKLTYMKESSQTQMRMPGDLLGVRADFTVSLREHRIDGGQMGQVIGSRVSEEVTAETSIFGSNAMGSAANPCNPCGKAMNPCNPCNPCGKAGNPCNPCGKAKNPCNPCGKAKNPCNPCGK